MPDKERKKKRKEIEQSNAEDKAAANHNDDDGNQTHKHKAKKQKVKEPKDDNSKEEDKPKNKASDLKTAQHHDDNNQEHKTKKQQKVKEPNDGTDTTRGDLEPSGRGGEEGEQTLQKTRAVLLRGVPYNATEDDVRNFFVNCPVSLRAIEIGKKRARVRSGTAFVMFSRAEEAQTAIETKHMKKMGERYIEICYCDPKTAIPIGAKQPTHSDKQKPHSNNDNNNNNNNNNNNQQKRVIRPGDTNAVFIAGLDYNIDDDAVHTLFSDCGEIKEIRWITDRNTGDFKCCGCVEFLSVESASLAMKHNGELLLNRPVRISLAAPKSKAHANEPIV